MRPHVPGRPGPFWQTSAMGKRRDEPDEPTLELPSFFRRKKRRGAEATAADVPSADPQLDTSAPVTAEAEPAGETAPPPEPAGETEPEPATSPAPRGRRPARARRTRPALSPGPASLVAGAVVGAVGTGLTWAALQGCEALRGTDSCGGPGLLVLVAILAVMVVAGALLLKALGVSEPNATSFLGVGLMTVIVLVTLMETLFSAWMFLAVPVLTALSYLAAQWVSTRFVDTEESSPGVDVR